MSLPKISSRTLQLCDDDERFITVQSFVGGSLRIIFCNGIDQNSISFGHEEANLLCDIIRLSAAEAKESVCGS
jgi:hypothetical protein